MWIQVHLQTEGSGGGKAPSDLRLRARVSRDGRSDLQALLRRGESRRPFFKRICLGATRVPPFQSGYLDMCSGPLLRRRVPSTRVDVLERCVSRDVRIGNGFERAKLSLHGIPLQSGVRSSCSQRSEHNLFSDRTSASRVGEAGLSRADVRGEAILNDVKMCPWTNLLFCRVLV